MEYARHEAIMNMPDKDGLPARETYKEAARKGSPVAIEMLEGKEYPVDLMYLYEWSIGLVGRSGVNQTGLNPLSYSEIESWSRVTGNRPDPEEVEALIALDSVMRHPETEVKKEEEPPKLTPVAAWPSRKNANVSGC